MGASISKWARWDDSVVPVPVADKDDDEPSQGTEAGEVAAATSGGQTHNVGPSLFQGAQNFTIQGGTFTLVNQQGASALDRDLLRKVLDFLSVVNFRSIQSENLAKWTRGTLKAFLESSIFQFWLETQGAILWGTGMPGAGKTILASVVIEHLNNIASKAPDICVAFVYCRYTEPMAVRDILAALVRQLLERYPHLLSVVEPMYTKHELQSTTPTQSELIDVIRHICSLFRMAFLSIDGLDEALYDEQFDLLETLRSVQANFIIASRPLIRLKNVLPHAEFFEIAAEDGDIELLVAQHIGRSPDLRQILVDEEARTQVVKKICTSSRGMFLHAALIVEATRQCTNRRDVMNLVEKFPAKLDALYDEAFRRIEGQGVRIAHQRLSWTQDRCR